MKESQILEKMINLTIRVELRNVQKLLLQANVLDTEIANQPIIVDGYPIGVISKLYVEQDFIDCNVNIWVNKLHKVNQIFRIVTNIKNNNIIEIESIENICDDSDDPRVINHNKPYPFHENDKVPLVRLTYKDFISDIHRKTEGRLVNWNGSQVYIARSNKSKTSHALEIVLSQNILELREIEEYSKKFKEKLDN